MRFRWSRVVGWMVLLQSMAWAAEPVVQKDLPYKSGDNLTEYEQTRCKLDVYSPADAKDAPVFIWFHGGGLTAGSKNGGGRLAASLNAAGMVFVSPNYRLNPEVSYPAYIEDAAAVVAWTHQHIAEYGGDPNRLFISGHSAGGYLTMMVGMDPHYLQDVGVPTTAIAGLIPVSGQTVTHFTVRKERGLGFYTLIADDAAPLRWVRRDLPPMLVIYADHDMTYRCEENALLVKALQGAKHPDVQGLMGQDRDHGTIASKLVNDDDPARVALLKFVANHPAPAAE